LKSVHFGKSSPSNYKIARKYREYFINTKPDAKETLTSLLFHRLNFILLWGGGV
jgi:hypothetical protein